MKKTGAKRDKDCAHTVCAIANGVSQSLLADARQIIDTARANAVRSVDFNRVMMYWNLGRRIFEEEQQGKDRAEYGTYLTHNLASALEPEYGSGFGVRQLEQSRQFYRTYPIANALRSQLNWTQYRLLVQIDDAQKREYYELESVNHCWTARETERQIHSQLWERLCLSNDKEAVLAVARKERNANRFPPEFMFALTDEETEELVTNCDRFRSVRHSSVPMRAFSEHGVIMVASVLKSDIAAQVSIRKTWGQSPSEMAITPNN